MDQEIRNKLRNVVTQCRTLLEKDIRSSLEGRFRIYEQNGEVVADPGAPMGHLQDDKEREARKELFDHLSHIKARGFKPTEALDQLVREIAFTHLNRFCAFKMMRARDVHIDGEKFRDAVNSGVNSNGVMFYLADHPDDERLFKTGKQDVAYRHFLNWLGGSLSDEIGVLFNPNDPANRLYPKQTTLDQVLDLLNTGNIKPEEPELREAWPMIWSQDETIGWVYQYFTPKELRDQARKESAAPRNSYELAFRNQFFTPRYVVEFLTDNTLGRIWYEMRKGDTTLKEQCRFMVRRPTESFLKEREQPPNNAAEGRDDLSQEELLKLPVHIPHRPKKDPRELRILDPACGSGHFLLYCFDLLFTIYEEAYADPDLSPALQKDYPKLEDLRQDVPRLILAHNLHGIDIDQRASQIAALALWLRCQRAYQEMGLKKDRPGIKRSNFVCAEPMPGEEQMLKEFVGQLEPKLLGQVVEVVFEKMKLAGEAGSLLRIEEEIRDAVAEAKRQFDMGGLPVQQSLFDKHVDSLVKRFSVKELTDASFFERAESKVAEALRKYAEKAQNGHRLQKRLFTEDAVRGFAFVDLCYKRFDVVLMNPPFGSGAENAKDYTSSAYPDAKSDVFACFVERAVEMLAPFGAMGAITNRTGFFLSSLEKWRRGLFLDRVTMTTFADLGHGVLDTAMVETAAYVAEKRPARRPSIFFRVIEDQPNAKAAALALSTRLLGASTYITHTSCFAIVPTAPFAYWVTTSIRNLFIDAECLESRGFKTYQGLITADDTRFLRLNWESPEGRAMAAGDSIASVQWAYFAKGGDFSPFYSPVYMAVDCSNGFRELIDNANRKYPYLNGGAQKMLHAVPDLFFLAGLNYTRRTTSEFSVRAIPSGCVFSDKGPAIIAPEGKTEELLCLLAILNSRSFRGLLSLSLGAADAAARSYETGIVARVPLPEVSPQDRMRLERLSEAAWKAQKVSSEWDETTALFRRPALVAAMLSERRDSTLRVLGESVVAQKREAELAIADALARIDTIVAGSYGLDDTSVARLGIALTAQVLAEEDEDGDDDSDAGSTTDIRTLVSELIACCVGTVFGRWDARLLTNGNAQSDRTTPFSVLPQLPYLSLRDSNQSAVTTTPAHYPIRISWDGICVDSPNDKADIVGGVQAVFELIWKDRAETIESEACEILGVKRLRDYFSKAGKGGFWGDHVSRYSRSRRKAPVYWLLQSKNRSFGLWIYYHRLDRDLLFKVVQANGPLQTRISLEQGRLDELYRQKSELGSSGKEAKKVAGAIADQEDILTELRDFSDRLERAANLSFGDRDKLKSGVCYDPDLNDGVVLNIAPLHEIVPWKEAKKCWEDLVHGKYEWSSMGKQLRLKGLVK